MTNTLWNEFGKYQYQDLTCDKCHETHQCTPWFDFYETPLWEGTGRVCELCFNKLVSAHMRELREGGQ